MSNSMHRASNFCTLRLKLMDDDVKIATQTEKYISRATAKMLTETGYTHPDINQINVIKSL